MPVQAESAVQGVAVLEATVLMVQHTVQVDLTATQVYKILEAVVVVSLIYTAQMAADLQVVLAVAGL